MDRLPLPSPTENASEQSIDGVVLGAVLQVGVEATMRFDRDQRCEIEFSGFKSFSPPPPWDPWAKAEGAGNSGSSSRASSRERERNMRRWVEENRRGRVEIDQLGNGGPALCEFLGSAPITATALAVHDRADVQRRC